MTTTSTNIALLSVDNTRTFEDASLNELYVSGGEKVATETHALLTIIKQAGWLLYNVLEEHPHGHLSLASNYVAKAPFTLLTKEEVDARTSDNHGIGPKAEFTLDELKAHLATNGAQMLRPDHSIENTPGVDLMPPLTPEQFDRKIIKGTHAHTEEYSWFTNGKLDRQLKADGIDTVIITWVATDYCVGLTALDAVKAGYTTYVVAEAIAGVAPETTEHMLTKWKHHGVQLISKTQLAEIFAPVTA